MLYSTGFWGMGQEFCSQVDALALTLACHASILSSAVYQAASRITSSSAPQSWASHWTLKVRCADAAEFAMALECVCILGCCS